MNVHVHIERLILDGLTLEGRHRASLQAAVEGELARLLEAQGLRPDLATTGTWPRLAAPAIMHSADHGADLLGHRIAGAVHTSLAGARQPSPATRARSEKGAAS